MNSPVCLPVVLEEEHIAAAVGASVQLLPPQGLLLVNQLSNVLHDELPLIDGSLSEQYTPLFWVLRDLHGLLVP